MSCCRKHQNEDEEIAELDDTMCQSDDSQKPFAWHPTINNIQQIAYVRRLECQLEALQSSYFTLSNQLARIQFRIRQIIMAEPFKRDKLIEELERVVFKEISEDQNSSDELPTMETYQARMGDVRKKQVSVINDLRHKIGTFSIPDDEDTEEVVDSTKEKKSKSIKSEASTKTLTNKASTISQKQSAISVRVSESKSRKPGGSDVLDTKSVSTTTDTQKAISAETSERSISFQELRNIYLKQFNLT